PPASNCSARWKTTSSSTITSVHTRRSTIRRQQICSRSKQKGTGPFPDPGSAPKPPRSRGCWPEWIFSLYSKRRSPYNRKCLQRIEQCRMRPERRGKPGIKDGAHMAASVVSPPHHLRTADFLSKRWGPPHFRHGSISSMLIVHTTLERYSFQPYCLAS